MKRIVTVAVITLLSIVGIIPAAQASAAPYCGITWGSAAKGLDKASSKQLIDVRTGRHGCYDRMVLQMNGPAAGYDVRYVSNVYADASNELITLTGGAKLRIVLQAPSYNPHTGTPTYNGRVNKSLPGVDLTGYQTFTSAKFAGSLEGTTTLGLGVRAQLPFRVFTQDNRVIIDVAHKW
jgi:hypothetical protein